MTFGENLKGFWQVLQQSKALLYSVVVVLLVTLLASVWLGHRMLQTVEVMSRSYAKPSVQVSVSGVVQSLHRQSKLVILSALITVDRDIEKVNYFSLLGMDFNLGNSNLRMISMGNKVQYYIPMRKISTNDVSWDAVQKVLTIRAPSPVVDAEMMELQSDPKQILLLGKDCWYDWATGGAQSDLKQTGRDSLRESLLRMAQSPAYLSLAEENAQRELEHFLKMSLSYVEPNASVVIEFKSSVDEAGNATGKDLEMVPAVQSPETE